MPNQDPETPVMPPFQSSIESAAQTNVYHIPDQHNPTSYHMPHASQPHQQPYYHPNNHFYPPHYSYYPSSYHYYDQSYQYYPQNHHNNYDTTEKFELNNLSEWCDPEYVIQEL